VSSVSRGYLPVAAYGPQQESGSGGRLEMKPRTLVATRFPQQRSASIQTRLVRLHHSRHGSAWDR